MPLTTEEAIAIVERFRTGMESDIADKQRVVDAYKVVESQLHGILDTPSQDMVVKQQELLAEKDTVASLEDILNEKVIAIATLQAEKITLESELATKVAELEAVKPVINEEILP